MITDSAFDTAGNQANSNYANSTITVSRVGGANVSDVFSLNLGGNAAALSGGYLYVGNNNVGNTNYTIGTFSSVNGVATISLYTTNVLVTANAVNAIMQGLMYSNTSSAPPAAVNLQYTFSDGYGVSGTATAYTTVNIARYISANGYSTCVGKFK